VQDVRILCNSMFILWHFVTSVVVAVRETASDFMPFLFRSYDNRRPGWNTGFPIRNPGRAYITRIWHVARATTAAPGLFSAVKLDGMIFRLVLGGIN
jgi:hypothetical protein